MGKKGGKKLKNLSDDEVDDANDELEAEMAAVAAMRAEKQQDASGGINDDAPQHSNSNQSPYNADGMRKCLEDIDSGLPFLESMVVDEFHFTVQNENDDIEREVHAMRLFYLLNRLDFICFGKNLILDGIL